jgi:phosphatidylserine/phosphatidylglycerophosphate/cardiolipin synthase-like enzyme
VIDNTVLIGSHNWSGGAFSDQNQESVAIRSAGLAEHVAAIFENQWQRAALE